MSRVLVPSAAVLLAVATLGHAAPEQITASDRDSRIQAFDPQRGRLAAIASEGDLTPGVPGNDDGSREVYLVDLVTRSLTQITASDRDASALRVTRDGDVVIGSRGDLTPGLPGNADRSFESWFYEGATGTLSQITSSGSDTFFQTYYRDGRRAFFVSKGDLTPGDPGNTDGRNEVYTLALGTGSFRQLTSTTEESLTRAIDPAGRYALVQSRGDLTPGAPGNVDGTFELYLLDLETLDLRQITASSADSVFAGWSDNGRYVAFHSTGDLVAGGNTDGSQEVFVHDLRKGSTIQVTASAGDSTFASFGPRSRRIAVHSRGDLLPGAPGNADGSQEVYVVNLRHGRTLQLTDSDADSSLSAFAPNRRWAAVVSTGDLTPGAPGNADGSDELFLVRVGVRGRVPIQVTDGADSVAGVQFDVSGRFAGFDARGELATGTNADGGREAYLTTVGRRPRVRQLTDGDADSELAAFLSDGRTVVLHSRADLDPTGPGNADGSLEVFVDTYR